MDIFWWMLYTLSSAPPPSGDPYGVCSAFPGRLATHQETDSSYSLEVHEQIRTMSIHTLTYEDDIQRATHVQDSACGCQLVGIRDEVLWDRKEMSSLYFGLDIFCQFEARVPEYDAVLSVQCTLYGGAGRCVSNSVTLASNRQNTASRKYNDDISLLISQYLILGWHGSL